MSGIEIVDWDEPLPERKEPEGGWKKACTVVDHKWALEVEGGKVSLVCLDPHPETFMDEVDPEYGAPVCLDQYWERDDLNTPRAIPVKVKHIQDNTPSTPNGPAEYGFWIEIEALDTPTGGPADQPLDTIE